MLFEGIEKVNRLDVLQQSVPVLATMISHFLREKIINMLYNKKQ